MQRTLLLLLVLLGIHTFAHAEIRTWTNTSGKTIKAEMVSSDKTTVSLELTNGKTVKIPINTLSPEDGQWIAEQNKPGIASFNRPWPDESKADMDYKVTVIQEGPEEYIYESPHFRFTANAKLGVTLMKRLGQIFEATYTANQTLPLNNIPTEQPDIKFPAFLYETQEQYLKAGGTEGSAGVHYRGKGNGDYGRILVPFKSLGVKKVGKSYSIDYQDDDAKTLSHEITHMLMYNEVKRAYWFTEGSAEYVGITPRNGGRFYFAGTKRSIVPYVTAYGKEQKRGRSLGKEIHLPSLKHFMTMERSEFMSNQTNRNYGVSALLVYYFYHADGNGDAARIKKYVQTLHKGAHVELANELLLDDRSWEQLSDEIVKYWKRSGITLLFAREDGKE